MNNNSVHVSDKESYNYHDSKILRTFIAINIYLPVVSPKLVYCSRLTCNKGKQTLRSILSTHHHDF